MPSSKFGSKFFGEERYQQYVDELTAEGTLGGEQLSPEERKEGFKKRNDKIGFEEFVNKVLEKKSAATTMAASKASLPGGVGGGGGGALVKAPKGGLVKADISKITPQESSNILEDILKIVTSIRDTLIEKNKFDADQSKKDKQSAERERRAGKEKKLESGAFKGLKKATEKVLAPVKSLFEKVFDFIKTVILGRIVYKIVEWMGNPDNAGKIESIIRFFSDWWPVIAGAYLLFGTKFGALIRTIGGWAIQIARFAIPKLLRFVTRNPKTAAVLAGAGYLGARILTGTEVGGDEEGSSEKETSQFQADQTAAKQTEGATPKTPEEKPKEMSAGGRVPGSGNRDTVPAMLTPGEFVMSKGAVAKFGTSTLASMNAMGGGTNIPSFSGGGLLGFQGGGSVPGGDEDKTKDQRGPMSWLGNLFGGGSKPKDQKQATKTKSSGGGLTDVQKKALGVLAKYESGAAGYNAVNQIGTAGGRGVKGFSGDIRKMSQHKGRSLTDFTIAEIKRLQHDDRSTSDSQWISAGKLHAVGRYQFIGNTLPGVAKRAGIPDNAKFSEGVQDLMALQLMKERGISPWVGPSDKATQSERAIVEQARKQPIKFDPSMPTGSSIAYEPGAGGDISSSGGGGGDISGSGGGTSAPFDPVAAAKATKTFDYMSVRKSLGVKTASISKSSRPSSSTSAYNQTQNAQQGQGQQKTEQKQTPGIPSFDAAAMSSPKKIKVLGITV
jgi:hypothetical protein